MEELLEFEENRGGKNLVSLIKYKLKFGSSHLVNPRHARSTLKETYDLDIKAIILLLGGFFYSLLKLLVSVGFQACKSTSLKLQQRSEKQKTN